MDDWRDLLFGRAEHDHPDIPGFNPRRHTIDTWDVTFKTETVTDAYGEPRTIERTEQHFTIKDKHKGPGSLFGGLMTWT